MKQVAADIIILTDGQATMEIETAEFTRCFNLAYCITTHCVQGSSYNFPYTIYEFHKMDSRLKYVAISRSTKIEYINMIYFFNIIYIN